MDRRGFLAGLTTSVAAVLSGCGGSAQGTASSASPSGSTWTGSGSFFQAPRGIVQAPVPEGTLTMLPGKGNLVALTVDDGTNTEVLQAYAMLAQRTGLRLTFFANGSMRSWTDHAPILRPLIDRGQAIICNHTWSHPDLTHLSDSKIAQEIQKNEEFLSNLYGVNGRPFLRPPYGSHNQRVDRMLAELGYPAVTMWWGSLGDSTAISTAQVLANAERWILPQRLVIGHANHPGVLSVMDKIVDLIHTRGLQPVHLADIFDVTQLPARPPSAIPSPTRSATPSPTRSATPAARPSTSPTSPTSPPASQSPSVSVSPSN